MGPPFYILSGFLAGYVMAYAVARSRNGGWSVSPIPGAYPAPQEYTTILDTYAWCGTVAPPGSAPQVYRGPFVA